MDNISKGLIVAIVLLAIALYYVHSTHEKFKNSILSVIQQSMKKQQEPVPQSSPTPTTAANDEEEEEEDED